MNKIDFIIDWILGEEYYRRTHWWSRLLAVLGAPVFEVFRFGCLGVISVAAILVGLVGEFIQYVHKGPRN